MIPAEHQECMQVLRYELNQKYEPHFDFFRGAATQKVDERGFGGQRVVTVLMYLTSVEEGGETVMPEARPVAQQP